ncbi:MAG: V-type ATPase 116kDa subunit family protein [Pseudomonadota bacterium]
MIVPMKKITLIFDSKKTQETLCALRSFGSFHPSVDKKSVSPEMVALKKIIEVVEKVLRLLPETGEKTNESIKNTEVIPFANAVIQTIESLKRVLNELNALNKELAAAKKWGKTDQELIRELTEKGIELRFFRCSKRDRERFPDSVYHFTAFEDEGEIITGVVLYREMIPTDLRFPEVFAPARGSHIVSGLIAEKEKERLSLEGNLQTVRGKREAIKKALLDLERELAFQSVSAGIIPKDTVSVLTGFCPESEFDLLQQIGEREAWAILSEMPKETDPAPTLVRHTKLSGLFKPVMDFVGIIPAYHEYDASMSFLVFFTLFFAILVGDAGYGAVILIGTVAFNRFKTPIPTETRRLLYLLSISAITWGAVTGIWFASEPVAELPFFKALVIPSIFGFSPESDVSIPRICMIIALVQLATAHIWRAARAFPSLLVFSELGWIAILCGVFFIIDFLILNGPASPFTKPLVVFGALCVFVFAGQNSDGFKSGMIRGLKNMPMTLLSGIGCFSDTVSYIRLFAVGLASKEMAVAFNGIAAGIGFDTSFSASAATLTLFSGHGINIALAVMAVLVHGIRLNVLEYSTHLHMEWTGIKYAPFR